MIKQLKRLLQKLSKKISRKNLDKFIDYYISRISNELDGINSLKVLNVGAGGTIETYLKTKFNFVKSIDVDVNREPDQVIDVCDIDQLKDLTNNIGVDVIFDPVGGELFEESSRALSRYGKILVIGFASGKIPKFPINLALVKEFDVVGVFWGAFTRNNTSSFKENMNELFKWFQEGKEPAIEPSISEICKELKMNKDDIISEAKTKLIEDKYLANTNSARENKIFGSPTFVVNNEIFWGDDRMEDAIKFFKK